MELKMTRTNPQLIRNKAILTLLFLFLFLNHVEAGPWQKICGHHAYVEYEAPYNRLAKTLLTLADAEIPRLARLHGFTKAQIAHWPKARIILTDKPDISNGFALGNSVVIYALSSMYLPYWSEQKSWYHLVLTHELTHWVTFKALKRKLNVLGEAAQFTVPRWFFEGVAQYFAESWNLFRGDYYIKQALLKGNLNAHSLENLKNGRLLYASAHAFIRYLSYTFGDSTLIRLFHYNPHGWYYDFDQAFKAVFHEKPDVLFSEFVRSAVLYYGDFLAHLPVATFPQKMPEFMEKTNALFPLSIKDSLFLVAGQEKSIDSFISLEIMQIRNKQKRRIHRLTDRLATDIAVSQTHRFIAYGEPYYSMESDQTAIRFQWYVYDRTHKATYKVLSPLRCRYADFAGDTQLYLVEVLPTGSRILRFDLTSKDTTIVFESTTAIGHLSASPDGTLFFTRQSKTGQRELCSLHDSNFKILSGKVQQVRSPIFLGNHYVAFNETYFQQPTITLYDLKTDSVVSRWMDQYVYWISGYDSARNALMTFRYHSNGKRQFFKISLDSLLKFPATLTLPKPNRYGQWQNKHPFLPDTLTFSNSDPTPPVITKTFPIFPMEHLFSFAMPFYDKTFGYGFYGSTLWMEALQRQLLAFGFWFTPLHPTQSVFLLNHAFKWLNTDISTYIYYGPVILTHPEGFRHQLNFDLHRSWFINGKRRFKFGAKIAYSYFDHHFKKNAPYPTKQAYFHGPSVRFSIYYHLPSLREMAIPRRKFRIELFYFKTMPGSNYNFNLFESDFTVGSTLFNDRIGFLNRLSYIRQHGHLLPFQIVGVDRYYELDMPRDYLFTRTIRGFRQNIDSDRMLWNSFEIRYFLKGSTPYQLIFLPIQNLTIDAFGDFANLKSTKPDNIAAFGLQVSFGNSLLRFSAGYARTFTDGQYYGEMYFGRISVLLETLE